jgi:hypothetical protein
MRAGIVSVASRYRVIDGRGDGRRRGCPLRAGSFVLLTGGARHHEKWNEEIDEQQNHHCRD